MKLLKLKNMRRQLRMDKNTLTRNYAKYENLQIESEPMKKIHDD